LPYSHAHWLFGISVVWVGYSIIRRASALVRIGGRSRPERTYRPWKLWHYWIMDGLVFLVLAFLMLLGIAVTAGPNSPFTGPHPSPCKLIAAPEPVFGIG
jgi:hypothetical protein